MIEGTERTNEEWLRELDSATYEGAAAHEDLRARVAVAVRKAAPAADEATLEDLIQVALVHVLRQRERFEGRSRFTTWAHAVAVRAALGELRRAAYRASGEALPQKAEEPADGLEPDEQIVKDEIIALMHRVIDTELTERQRTALLGELAETPRETLLARLGINANALHKLLHDARRKLQAGLCAAGICDDEVRQAFDL